jgi:hypothetical protein
MAAGCVSIRGLVKTFGLNTLTNITCLDSLCQLREAWTLTYDEATPPDLDLCF